MATRKRVELLFFADCPNWEAARRLVERIAAEEDVPTDLVLIEIGSPQEAEQCRFLGSPTLRVDGVDVEPGVENRDAFIVACRVYRTGVGLCGLPLEEWVREALVA